jgi:hypothetical protein
MKCARRAGKNDAFATAAARKKQEGMPEKKIFRAALP